MSTRIIRQEQDVHIFDEADVTRAMNETQRDKIRLIGVCVIVGGSSSGYVPAGVLGKPADAAVVITYH